MDARRDRHADQHGGGVSAVNSGPVQDNLKKILRILFRHQGGNYLQLLVVEIHSLVQEKARSTRTVCVFLSYLAETSPGMGGVEGARAALRHHFTVEQPQAPNPVEGKEMGLVMMGLRRRFQIPVKKKVALSKDDFFCILRSATDGGQFSKVRVDFFEKGNCISVCRCGCASYGWQLRSLSCT